MTKGDLSCLRPGNPITRKVLSNDGPNQLGGGRTLSQIISECSLHRFNRRLKLCCKIFIPVQDDVPGQWFFIVIKLKDKVVEIWDTISDPFPMRRRHELATSVVQLVQKVFASDMKKPGDIYYNIENFDFCARSYETVFCGEHDSGVCLIRNMQSYGEPWFEGFQSNKQRTEIALGIVSNQKNEQLKSVDVAAVLTLRALVAEQEGVPENYNDTTRNERKGPT
ncbi:uncharacterized protein LOC126794109 isoform X2 [Argentina anserina]|uniref:uncharacterized protein LOC126794109 isoform X2 n=1 Tax=Argentina anserina TaxID=57926 RepID=UPI0021766D04|nr:uncharacterized protein LOC126794109 isoform X2 [Potentilla anserina]